MSDRRVDYGYPIWSLLLVSVLCLAPLAGLYAAVAVIPAKEFAARLIVAVPCVGLLALALLMLYEAAVWRLTVTNEGLECVSPWRGSCKIAWEDVNQLKWSQVAQWFIITTKRGRWFRFTWIIGDLGRLLGEFERKLEPEQLARAEAGYLFIRRPFPYREQRPATVVRPTAGPTPRRQPVPGIDLSKWGDRRR